MRKFLDPSYDATGTTMHTTPWFFIRLSEIYLNYAECQIELGILTVCIVLVQIVSLLGNILYLLDSYSSFHKLI